MHFDPKYTHKYTKNGLYTILRGAKYTLGILKTPRSEA